jgi:hypothetical protein
VSSLSRDVVRARGLSPTERRLLLEAVVWLGLVRVATAMLPYRRVASLLRLTQSPASNVSPDSTADRGADRGHRDADASGRRDAEAVGWAVQGAAGRTPWPSTCLVQSLAGYVMLRRHGVPSVVYLGVGKDAAGEFTAHSWLRCGDRIVTGGGSHQRYSAIAAYRPATQPATGRRG